MNSIGLARHFQELTGFEPMAWQKRLHRQRRGTPTLEICPSTEKRLSAYARNAQLAGRIIV